MRFGLLEALSARRSLPVFLAGVAYRLMERDRNIEQQRARERTEQLADLAIASQNVSAAVMGQGD